MSWSLDAKNATWLLADKFIRLVGGVVVGVVVARYLGPEHYGQLNFAQAWVGMFAGIAWFGVGDTVVRDFVAKPAKDKTILGSAFRLRLLGSALASALALVSLVLTDHRGSDELQMAGILCIAILLVEPVSASMLWLQARRTLKPVGVARTLGFVLHQAYRLGAVAFGLGVVAVAAGAIVEALVFSTLLLLFARNLGVPHFLNHFDRAEAMRILREGIPVMLAGLLGTLFLRIDQVILGQLSGNHELGLYGAAVRLSEPWWAIPTILAQVMAPRLLFAMSATESDKRDALVVLSTVFFYLAASIAVVVSATASTIVPWLFGEQYAGTAPILVIHVWIAIFVFLDAAAYQYLIALHYQRFIIRKTALALSTNALLSWVVAPRYGAIGVAYATLVSYALSATLVYALSPLTRQILVSQLRGILFPHHCIGLLQTKWGSK